MFQMFSTLHHPTTLKAVLLVARRTELPEASRTTSNLAKNNYSSTYLHYTKSIALMVKLLSFDYTRITTKQRLCIYVGTYD